MERKTPAQCASMADVRHEIDQLDDQLVALIAERFAYVDRAWQLKHADGREGAHVPWRIQQVIDRVRALAGERGLPPEMVEMIGSQWRNMIGWFVQYEEEKLRKAMEETGAAQRPDRGDGDGAPRAAGPNGSGGSDTGRSS